MREAADTAIRQSDGTPGSGMVAIIGADEQVNSCATGRGWGDVLVAANSTRRVRS